MAQPAGAGHGACVRAHERHAGRRLSPQRRRRDLRRAARRHGGRRLRRRRGRAAAAHPRRRRAGRADRRNARPARQHVGRRWWRTPTCSPPTAPIRMSTGARPARRVARWLDRVLAWGPKPAKAMRRMPFLIPVTAGCSMISPAKELYETARSDRGRDRRASELHARLPAGRHRGLRPGRVRLRRRPGDRRARGRPARRRGQCRRAGLRRTARAAGRRSGRERDPHRGDGTASR